MKKFYVHTSKDNNGDHEVHEEGCNRMPLIKNRLYLGAFSSCEGALKEASKHYSSSSVDGCYYCCNACNKR